MEWQGLSGPTNRSSEALENFVSHGTEPSVISSGNIWSVEYATPNGKQIYIPS